MLKKIIKRDSERRLTPQEEKKAREYGNFMQKLKDEGKLSEYLKARMTSAKGDELRDLLK